MNLKSDLVDVDSSSFMYRSRLMRNKAFACAMPLWRALFLGLIFISLSVAARLLGFQSFLDGQNSAAFVMRRFRPYASRVYPLATRIVEDVPKTVPMSLTLVHVQDVVAFPEEVMLIVRTSDGPVVPVKDGFQCIFGESKRTDVLSLEWRDPRSLLYARCPFPVNNPIKSNLITLGSKDSDQQLPSTVEYSTPPSWKSLVYDSVLQSDWLLLFVKGLVDSKGKPLNLSKSLHKMHCVFGDEVNTSVTAVAQEVVRCQLPSYPTIQDVEGLRVSLSVPKVGVLPSVAYFAKPSPSIQQRKAHFLCACTMVRNQAMFLKEWVMYHGFLGVERWFLYDNNSDDDLHEVVEDLAWYNVTRHSWPWIKTQEAGFSHCAVRAKPFCQWVMFMDVDEFVFPAQQLSQLLSQRSSLLPTLSAEIDDATVLKRLLQKQVWKAEQMGVKVGEVRLLCHNFGPSGWTHAPEQGVMVGYSCRMKWPERHKSFLLLDALDDSLLNVVHHFKLKDEYQQIAVHQRIAVINHYKYQAWPVFRTKFFRRVATYVADWKESQGDSKDKAPGLGNEDVEPTHWENKFCEEWDSRLKNFTISTFMHPQTKRMLWEGWGASRLGLVPKR